jgi:hypothetical protein
MSVLVEVGAGTNGDPFGEIFATTGNTHADQRFCVGAHTIAELIAQRRERASPLEPKQKIHRCLEPGWG